MARVDDDRTPIGVYRLFQLTIRLEDDAKVAVPIRLIRHQREAPLDERDRFVAAPLLMRKYAGIVQSARMIWGHLDNAAIQLVGLRELLIFLQQDGEFECFLDRQLACRSF